MNNWIIVLLDLKAGLLPCGTSMHAMGIPENEYYSDQYSRYAAQWFIWHLFLLMNQETSDYVKVVIVVFCRLCGTVSHIFWYYKIFWLT
jgi:hypothetical protein